MTEQVATPFWAQNAEHITAVFLKRAPDYSDPISCRQWLLGLHIALALNAAELIFLAAPPNIDSNQDAAQAVRATSKVATGLILANAFEIYRAVGAVEAGLISDTFRLVEGSFENRFRERAGSMPMGGMA